MMKPADFWNLDDAPVLRRVYGTMDRPPFSRDK